MIQSAETRRNLHTHTHTHTGKLLPSIKQIVPICFAFYFLIFPNFTFADNITASSTCTNGVLGTYTGPADIEANFDPNTINTTWYSNGTQLTGNNIPGTCTYDNALTPPTPENRPGYVFAGWKLKICSLAELDPTHISSNDSNHISWKPLDSAYSRYGTMTQSGMEDTSSSYGLNSGEWLVIFDEYGTIRGASLCSDDYAATMGATGSPSGPNGRFCWCKATDYTPNGDVQCSLNSTMWTFRSDFYTDQDCKINCTHNCLVSINDQFRPNFRRGLYGQQ